MTIAVLELQRARKQLEAFCRRHSAATNSEVEWCLSNDSGGFLLTRSHAGSVTPIVRLQYTANRWLLSVPSADGWRAYPPRPAVADIAAVIDELEQAPLHVHWG